MYGKVLMTFGCLVAVALGGCGTYRGKPVGEAAPKTVCVLENAKAANSAEFLAAYRLALEARGIEAVVKPAGSAVDGCPVASRYNVYWEGGGPLRVRNARIDLYREGRVVSSSVFQSQDVGPTRTNEVLIAMVEELLPRPIELAGNRLCIIENARVADGPRFLEAYRKVLEARGFQTEVLPALSPLGACPVTTKYAFHSGFDGVPYITAGRLDVYKDGRPAGSATYAPRASRFVGAEEAIEGMVDRLFPRWRP